MARDCRDAFLKGRILMRPRMPAQSSGNGHNISARQFRLSTISVFP